MMNRGIMFILLVIIAMPTVVANTMSFDEPDPARVAFVMPTFSNTAYSIAFYNFYRLHIDDNQTYVTTDLQFLNVTVKPGWSWSKGLDQFLKATIDIMPQLFEGGRWTIIDERDVAAGALFLDNGSRAYDVAVCGFIEYVTAREYADFKRFVATGGTLVLNDACNFLAEVAYYPCANGSGYLSLVNGHGWAFNGTHAWRSVYHRWPEENRNWVGSNYWKWWEGTHYDGFDANTTHPISEFICSQYGTHVSGHYGAHEENKIENMTNTRIVGYWHFINCAEAPIEPVAAYQHDYLEGTVFHSGIMASEVLCKDIFVASFLIGAIRMGLGLNASHDILYEEMYPPITTTDTTTTSTATTTISTTNGTTSTSSVLDGADPYVIIVLGTLMGATGLGLAIVVTKRKQSFTEHLMRDRNALAGLSAWQSRISL